MTDKIHKKFREEFPDLAERCEGLGIGVYAQKGARKDLLGFPMWRMSHEDFQMTGFRKDTPESPYTRDSMIERTNKKLDRIEAGRAEAAGWSRKERALHVLEKLGEQDLGSHFGQRGYSQGAWYYGSHDSGDYAHALVSYGVRCVGVQLYDEPEELLRVRAEDEGVDDPRLIDRAIERVSELEAAA